MKRPLRVVGMLAWMIVGAWAVSREQQAAASRLPPQPLSAGVTLTVDQLGGEPRVDQLGITRVGVTLANRGVAAMRVKYRDFALSGGAGQLYPALLPAELAGKAAPERLLHEGILEVGGRISAFLYFRSPRSGPVDLRVDLIRADGSPVSQTFIHLKR